MIIEIHVTVNFIRKETLFYNHNHANAIYIITFSLRACDRDSINIDGDPVYKADPHLNFCGM